MSFSPGKSGKARNIGRSKLYGENKVRGIARYVLDGIIIFTSNDDISSHILGVSEYKKELPAKVIELKNHGHFTFRGMGTEEFPELLQEVLK